MKLGDTENNAKLFFASVLVNFFLEIQYKNTPHCFSKTFRNPRLGQKFSNDTCAPEGETFIVISAIEFQIIVSRDVVAARRQVLERNLDRKSVV